jgi:hypothetical protein
LAPMASKVLSDARDCWRSPSPEGLLAEPAAGRSGVVHWAYRGPGTRPPRPNQAADSGAL